MVFGRLPQNNTGCSIYIGMGKYAQATAKTIAGTMFSRRILFFQTKLMPTQKTKIAPDKDKLVNAAVVIYGAAKRADKVITPWIATTGITENMQPFPKAAANAMRTMLSKAVLKSSMDKSPLAPSLMAPMMAMAPMETVIDAVTKAVVTTQIGRASCRERV